MQLLHGLSLQDPGGGREANVKGLTGLESLENRIIRDGYSRMFGIPGTFYRDESLLAIVSGIDHRKIPLPPSSVVKVPSGLTYFGQFVDHDVTKMALLENLPNPLPVALSTVQQLRSPALDLDSLYGHGLEDPEVPYLGAKFDSQFKLDNGLIFDLPRGVVNDGYAPRIPDNRNDENLIIAQLHVAFMNMHNQLVDRYRQRGITNTSTQFQCARRELTLLYQLVLVNEFLETFLDKAVFNFLFRNPDLENGTISTILDAQLGDVPTIPVEFAGAAFRFGHALVRDSYQLNSNQERLSSLRELFYLTGKGQFQQGKYQTLRSFTIDWEFFFNINGSRPFNTLSIKPILAGGLRKLVNELSGNQDLLYRNLCRGSHLGLPSAQNIVNFIHSRHPDYARQTGLMSLTENQFKSYGIYEELAQHAMDIQTPLWLYVLMEPFYNNSENMRLGKLGSIIIGETFRAVLLGSDNSIFETGLDLNALEFATLLGGADIDLNDWANQHYFSMGNLIEKFQVNRQE